MKRFLKFSSGGLDGSWLQVILHEVPMKQDRNAQDLVTLTVRVTRSQADALKRVADLEDRPVAAELRRLIKRRVGELPEAA